MALSTEYIAAWQQWHDDRIKDLNRPHGFLSVVCQDWLTEGELYTSEFVPGQWLLKDGEIYYHPDPERAAKGEFLSVDGKQAKGPTHIPHGYNKNSGTGSAVALFYEDLEVETITRVNSRGETIHAIRVRDPQEAARKRFDDIETFPLSEAWVVPAKFVAAHIELHNVPTVDDSVYEASFTIGHIELTINGQAFSLEVSGHRAGSQSTGYFSNYCYVHFGDQTNGKETYGGGRIIKFADQAELEALTALDFNRAVSFPCALSTFVACPSTPAGSRLPFRVPAGEYTPPVPHERISTYKG
ncbi:DUF1684 domain-containing protein [Candidimonas nitroreducens]|uniref:DUF1684 domain-containing protein n=1 Tax=Candidimonas nitroreducens TaxID=683354 RepID=A0A225LZZ3_9BURK|nr:DUF1684 domain-containing protein [Candidimonas nitroreducens]OWT54516.1 hypothetical protein CEY11_22635 [Candidimonas nitroreducens]